VLLVGIDGAAPRLTERLIGEGRLPVLARLGAEGAMGRLRSELPLYSPRVWNTIATGKSPEQHGIRGFYYEPEPGRRELFLSRDRKVLALWNIASDAGLRVAVVNWWNTFPPDEVNGILVSDHAFTLTRANRAELFSLVVPGGETVFPPEWRARVEEEIARQDPPVDVPDPFARAGLPPWADREGLSGRYQEDADLTRIALEIEKAEHPDLLMVLLHGIDPVSHGIWAGQEPHGVYPPELAMTADQHLAMKRALEDYYAYTDALIGRLVREFDANDLIVVVSDHGFERFTRPGAITTGDHRTRAAIDGVVFLRGPGIPAGTRLDGISIYDVLPTVLAFLGLPAARDMGGHPVSALRAASPPPPVATYDTHPVRRLEGDVSGRERAILEELRALGYLD
jgi:predicted AlkP superfamily phosphohydrolase/phosphomutase